jgi:hypothetical protein
MNLLHEPPPAFDGITKAFAMAKHLPTTKKLAVKVGLARDGVLVGVGELDGYRQVTFFSEHMRDLGYQERLLGGEDEMFGCDILFTIEPQTAGAADDDPSFIRRPAAELWPVRS